MYCEDIQSPFRTWSQWFKLLLHQYIPRTSALKNSNPHLAISVLHTEMEEASLNFDVLQFDLIYRGAHYELHHNQEGQLFFLPEYDFFGKVVPLHHLLKVHVGRKPCYIILAQGGLQFSSLAFLKNGMH